VVGTVLNVADVLLERWASPFWNDLKQVGVDHAIGILPRSFADWPKNASELPWDYTPMALYKQQVNEADLTLAALEDTPPMEAIRVGGPGREEEIEHFVTLVRNMGRLGIPVLCYSWMSAIGPVRTSVGTRGRAGSVVSAYDHSIAQQGPRVIVTHVDDEQLWKNLTYFLERVLPVAEDNGVKLAMHPDDPPVSPIRGVDRIMTKPEAFQRLIDLFPSEANGMTLCQGNFSLMTHDLPAVIRDFGGQGKIFYVHFRGMRGSREGFVETFHNEPGRTDLLECVRAYRDVGYEGAVRTDRVPTLDGDGADAAPGYATTSRLYAVGYVQGLIRSAYAESAVETEAS
jgi:mannonate dehydratase